MCQRSFNNDGTLRIQFSFLKMSGQAVHRHFEGQWPKPKKGALRGWVVNYPVVTKCTIKREDSTLCNNFRLYFRCFIRVGTPSLFEPASASSSMEVEESGVSWSTPCTLANTLLHLHLADAFIQSDLQCIQAIHFFQYVCSLGIEPTTFCAANAMLYHWATGTLLHVTMYFGTTHHFCQTVKRRNTWGEWKNSKKLLACQCKIWLLHTSGCYIKANLSRYLCYKWVIYQHIKPCKSFS